MIIPKELYHKLNGLKVMDFLYTRTPLQENSEISLTIPDNTFKVEILFNILYVVEKSKKLNIHDTKLYNIKGETMNYIKRLITLHEIDDCYKQ